MVPGRLQLHRNAELGQEVCHEYYWAHKYDLSAPTTLFIEGAPPGPPAPGFCGTNLFTGTPLPC